MSQADLACHKAKNTGRNRFEIYESSSDTMTGMAKEISVSNEINEALQNDSFVLHFQPIVSLETGKISHYESLVRMRVKGKNGRIKLLLPDAFIPAAIRFDQMVLIDRWVLQHAIQKLAEVRTTQPDTIFTINVSGNMFETKDFIEFLESILDEHGVPMSSIVLEITEQVAIRTMALSKAIISKLSDKGCRFALDDFGAGFSSYSYLKALPVDYIKIDGSFIHDIVKDVVDQKIVTSLVDIARATGKQTIAEHVANKAVLDILCDLGVDYAQGHYLGRPARKLK
jgi:EAL domain-containing protein (putative c-di-GMP-specific phosphodiesterase class I)